MVGIGNRYVIEETMTDRDILRNLATQVRDIAALPIQSQRIKQWKAHNALKPGRPMLLVFPEGAWGELMPQSILRCQDPAARGLEWNLRERIYYHEHFADDTVIHSTVDVTKHLRSSGYGLQAKSVPSPVERGAWAFDPVVQGPSDLAKLTLPRLEHNEAESLASLQRTQDWVGDILKVRLVGHRYMCFSLMSIWARLRGLEQVMMDMIEEPQFLHDAMARLTEIRKAEIRQMFDLDLVSLNNDHFYHSSGGNGWTDELPAPGYTGRPRPQDMWASCEAQELAQVSPEMHEEFALRYERDLLEPFGLTGYGCCEPLHDKLDYVLKLKNIRRISMSPWTNLAVAAQKLGRRAIFSWKPNPATLVGNFDEGYIRRYIREALQTTRGCVVEVVLKDTHTIEQRPQRMDRWLQIAKEEIDRLG